MTITGLENNYYLAGNGIWIQISNFPKVPIRLELKVTNINTSVSYPLLRLYPDQNNVFQCNICQAVRPLQPYPNHITVNTLQNYRMEFTVTFEDNTTEATTLEKYFIRGGRTKNSIDEWYLQNGQKLVIGTWVDWRGIMLPGYANKIQEGLIVNYIPPATETYKMILPSGCNAMIIKFRNSLGGYQYWVFETYEIKPKIKGKNTIYQIPHRLRDDASLNTGIDASEEITLKTKTPAELQPIILDLIKSPEILMYNPDGRSGVDDLSSWTRLELSNSNDAILNSNDMSYANELTYILPNYINRDL